MASSWVSCCARAELCSQVSTMKFSSDNNIIDETNIPVSTQCDIKINISFRFLIGKNNVVQKFNKSV